MVCTCAGPNSSASLSGRSRDEMSGRSRDEMRGDVVRKLMTYPKILAVTVLVIGLSLEATANSFTTFSFSNGTFAANSSLTTITLSPASVLTTVTGGPCSPACSGANLGSVTFTTAALMSGSLAAGGTFAPGGMLTVTGNGMHGVPSGILFQGTFTTGTWVVT